MSRRRVNRTDAIGTRLLPTADAILQHVVQLGEKATLVGFGRQPHLITVIRDGLQTRQSYHRMFWRRAQTRKEAEKRA